MTRLRCVSISAWLLCALTLASPVAAQQRKAGDLVLKPYVFENSKREKTNAELGVLVVRENRSNPNSNLIELAFVRFKSTARLPGPPIVYLAGGPGGSGVSTAMGSRFPLFMAMREVGDVIALDQRGIGMSKPSIGCWDLLLNIPLDVVPSREVLTQAYLRRSRSCADYWRNWQRVDLGAYNTNESADDLEDLRKALGAKQISLWGISYGTHLTLAAIRRHPTSINRAILAGTEGPDHTYKLPSSIQQHLEDLSAVVRADTGVGKQVPDLLGLMRQVFDTLDKKTVVVEITDPLTKQPVKVMVNGFVMRRIVANNIGSTVTAAFPKLFYRASKGDYEDAAYSWLNQTRESLGSAMSYMMDCSSGVTAARRERIQREASMTMLGTLMNDPFPEVCEAWNAPDLGDEFRSPVKSNIPVLFISGTLDARTPIAQAEEYRAGFTNSQHLILEGAVHSDPLFLSSPKIKEVMLEFMMGRPLSATRITVQRIAFTPIVQPSTERPR
jgi:pimeloyl-ACP methyl ester carboxylesterase